MHISNLFNVLFTHKIVPIFVKISRFQDPRKQRVAKHALACLSTQSPKVSNALLMALSHSWLNKSSHLMLSQQFIEFATTC